MGDDDTPMLDAELYEDQDDKKDEEDDTNDEQASCRRSLRTPLLYLTLAVSPFL